MTDDKKLLEVFHMDDRQELGTLQEVNVGLQWMPDLGPSLALCHFKICGKVTNCELDIFLISVNAALPNHDGMLTGPPTLQKAVYNALLSFIRCAGIEQLFQTFPLPTDPMGQL